MVYVAFRKGEFNVFLWLPFVERRRVGAASSQQGETLVNQGAIAALQFWRNLMRTVQVF